MNFERGKKHTFDGAQAPELAQLCCDLGFGDARLGVSRVARRSLEQQQPIGGVSLL